MKSIATELVNNWDMHISSILVTKAKAHALTCQTILDNIKEDKLCDEDLIDWLILEIKILKDGGLI